MAPSKLIHGTDFHLFKEGIEPKWEDPKCARGGKWTFTAPKTSNRGTLDSYWLNTVRAACRVLRRTPRRCAAPRTRRTPPPPARDDAPRHCPARHAVAAPAARAAAPADNSRHANPKPLCARAFCAWLHHPYPTRADVATHAQLLALIGEQFPDPGEICGAVVNVRNKGDRISIWTRTGGNEAAQMAVGKCMKQVLDLNETTRLGYMLHDDAIKLDRKAKDRYTV